MEAQRAAQSRLNGFLRALGLIVGFYLLWAALEWAALKIPGLERVDVREIVIPWTMLASVVVTTYVTLRLVEKRPWSTVALDRAAVSPRTLLRGAAFGGLTIGVASLVLITFHQLQIERSIPGSWWLAAEHSTAIVMALKNKMDLSVGIAIGSSLQIALFVAPLLVFLSYLFGRPMDLEFSLPEIFALVASVYILFQISGDGETNWIEGVQLLSVYLILGILFFYLPETHAAH